MTQEALKLALDWAEAHGEIVFAGGGMSAVNKMNSWVAAIKKALAQEKALQALHSENERLGLYKDAYAQPEQVIQDSTCSITLRLQGKPYPRTCKKCGLGPCIAQPMAQRTWVGLTDDDWKEIEDMPDTFDQGVAWAQAKLKDKNT